MTSEVFKDIPNYEGIYQISNLGRVKSLERKRHNKCGVVKSRILKQILSGKKCRQYYCVNLYCDGRRKSFKVHLLMSVTFLNHKPNGCDGLVVDHIDNNSLNNNLNNLQLITFRENTTKDRVGTSKYRGVAWCKSRNKWRVMIRNGAKREFLGRFNCELKASIIYEERLRQISIEQIN